MTDINNIFAEVGDVFRNNITGLRYTITGKDEELEEYYASFESTGVIITIPISELNTDFTKVVDTSSDIKENDRSSYDRMLIGGW